MVSQIQLAEADLVRSANFRELPVALPISQNTSPIPEPRAATTLARTSRTKPARWICNRTGRPHREGSRYLYSNLAGFKSDVACHRSRPVRISTISTGQEDEVWRSGDSFSRAGGCGACGLVCCATALAFPDCVLFDCRTRKIATARRYPSARRCTRATSPTCSRFAATAPGS